MDLVEMAERLRDGGMKMAAEAQDAENHGWSDRAYIAIKALALTQATLHIDDLLRTFKERPVGHPNAAATPWRRAIKEHLIIHSGRVKKCESDPLKRGHGYPIYLSLLYRRT